MKILSFILIASATLFIGAANYQTPIGQQSDGPYVLCNGTDIIVNHIINENGVKSVKRDSFLLSEKKNISFNVATDSAGQFFTVQLKANLEVEKAESKDVKKQFVISDIEGNFKAFRKLLQTHQIIDDNFNWTFGEGHLVLTGDFFDRGDQVTEVLWLIYALEDKAKAAGGYVHFILGNHEIMNLSNDIRYVHPKYIENAGLMNVTYVSLFSTCSELGQWLRSKNVMETIGDVLYVHAGISPDVNELYLSASKLNKIVRPYYDDTTYRYPDLRTEILYGEKGPFWYRGYYTGDKATNSEVLATLKQYKVSHIATGHTVVADTISALYGGKVFNTDVHHAKGISEALFIDHGKFYRATATGKKIQIGN